MEYSVGETVVYGGSGVCEISEIKDVQFGRERPQKYYILKPLFDKQALVVYVPFNNEKLTAKIQPIISKEEALDLIRGIGTYDCEWIEDRNLRKETYTDMVSSGERKSIIGVISAISGHRDRLADEGKSLNMQDEKLLYEAQKRMDAEFAVALELEYEDVQEFIRVEKAKAV